MKQNQEDYQKFMEEMKNTKGSRRNTEQNVVDDFDEWDDWDDDQKKDNLDANIHYFDKLIADLQKSKEEKKKETEDQLVLYKRQDGILNNHALKFLEKQKEEKKEKMPPYLENISKDVMINRKMKILL